MPVAKDDSLKVNFLLTETIWDEYNLIILFCFEKPERGELI